MIWSPLVFETIAAFQCWQRRPPHETAWSERSALTSTTDMACANRMLWNGDVCFDFKSGRPKMPRRRSLSAKGSTQYFLLPRPLFHQNETLPQLAFALVDDRGRDGTDSVIRMAAGEPDFVR